MAAFSNKTCLTLGSITQFIAFLMREKPKHSMILSNQIFSSDITYIASCVLCLHSSAVFLATFDSKNHTNSNTFLVSRVTFYCSLWTLVMSETFRSIVVSCHLNISGCVTNYDTQLSKVSEAILKEILWCWL